MKHRFTLLVIFAAFSACYSQNQNLLGKWILVRTMFADGRNVEINNPAYSSKLTYTISPKKININDQNFDAAFTSDKISTPFRKMNYAIKDKYLMVQENGDDKISYFLKVADFIKAFPEFALKETERNGNSLYIGNNLSDYEFQNSLSFDEFIRKNMKERSSESMNNLYFKVEFVLTKDNKLKDIKILNSIDASYDSDYISALRKSEPFLKNLTDKDLLVVKESQHLKWRNDLTNQNEKKLYDLRAKGLEFYQANKFEKAIEQFSQIEDLNIRNDRFQYFIKECRINLGVSYLATGQKEKACETFAKAGDRTVFDVRNYLIDFCGQ